MGSACWPDQTDFAVWGQVSACWPHFDICVWGQFVELIVSYVCGVSLLTKLTSVWGQLVDLSVASVWSQLFDLTVTPVCRVSLLTFLWHLCVESACWLYCDICVCGQLVDLSLTPVCEVSLLTLLWHACSSAAEEGWWHSGWGVVVSARPTGLLLCPQQPDFDELSWPSYHHQLRDQGWLVANKACLLPQRMKIKMCMQLL